MKMDRRSFLLACASPLLARPANRLAICSETFAGLNFADACKAARRTGYAAIEIEPAHLSPDPANLAAAARRDTRAVISGEGLACAGLHSFLKAPAGLHLTTPDEKVRQRSWETFRRLIDLAADLADSPVMVLGSSKQREALPGVSPATATARLTEGLHRLAPHAAERGVWILMEPLAPHLCNVVNTMAQAMAVVRDVNSPAVQTIFDAHNTAAETQPLEALLRQYFPWIRHVHLNEMDGRRPGTGDFPFSLVLATLRELGYQGWLSVEVFDFRPDGETVGRLAADYLQRLPLLPIPRL